MSVEKSKSICSTFKAQIIHRFVSAFFRGDLARRRPLAHNNCENASTANWLVNKFFT
jgi:hypothetical protein